MPKNEAKRPFSWVFLSLSFLLVGLDQGTKVLTQIFRPDLIILNPEGSLGFFPEWSVWLALVVLIFWLLYQRNFDWGEALVLAGGLSNLLDRFIHRSVLDFIRFGFLPVFNFADILIVLGVAIVFLETIRARSALE